MEFVQPSVTAIITPRIREESETADGNGIGLAVLVEVDRPRGSTGTLQNRVRSSRRSSHSSLGGCCALLLYAVLEENHFLILSIIYNLLLNVAK